jgi:hypothetical protein
MFYISPAFFSDKIKEVTQAGGITGIGSDIRQMTIKQNGYSVADTGNYKNVVTCFVFPQSCNLF